MPAMQDNLNSRNISNSRYSISSNNKVPRKVLMPETPGTPETLATTMADGNVNSSMNSSNSRECRHSRTPGISTAVRNQ